MNTSTAFIIYLIGMFFGFSARRIKSKYLEYFDRSIIFVFSVLVMFTFFSTYQVNQLGFLVISFVSGFLAGLSVRGVPGTYVI